jgi:hypothetical protein
MFLYALSVESTVRSAPRACLCTTDWALWHYEKAVLFRDGGGARYHSREELVHAAFRKFSFENMIVCIKARYDFAV